MQYSKNFTRFLLLVASLTFHHFSSGHTVSGQLEWKMEPYVFSPYENKNLFIYTFDEAYFNPTVPTLPYYVIDVPLKSNADLSVRLTNAVYESFEKIENEEDDHLIGETLQFGSYVQIDRRSYMGKVSFIPIIKVGKDFRRLVRFSLEIETKEKDHNISFRNGNKFNSALKEGDIFKIQTNSEGIHKVTFEYLQNELGLTSGPVNSSHVQLFGNGSGQLPELVSEERIDDLEENAILMSDGGDGTFGPGDYFLFYAPPVHPWAYSASNGAFTMTRNIYEDYVSFFIRIHNENGERISNQSSIGLTAYSTDAFDDYQRYEDEKTNLLDQFSNASGSGKEWYGDHFLVTRSYDYPNTVSFTNTISSEPAFLRAQFAARRSGTSNNSSYRVKVDDQTFSKTIGGVKTTDIESTYARVGVLTTSFSPNDGQFDITVEYPNVSSGTSEGWLDYFEINVRRQLNMTGNQMPFRDTRSMNFVATTYSIQNTSGNTKVWDITDPLNPVEQLYDNQGNGRISFGTESESLRTFIAFEGHGAALTPKPAGKVENQNLHGIEETDLLIVYHPDFEDDVLRLAEHRRTHDDYLVSAVEIEQVYNEFSSGQKDPTAIRDMAKMLLDRSDRFKYLLLFGDGSFDYKNYLGLSDPQQFLPPYETRNSDHPIKSFPSDDFFGLLSPGEGDPNLNGAIDIAVGRIPARNAREAKAVVDKIIQYDTDPEMFGDWKLRLTFVGDDEDSNLHISQVDGIARKTDGIHKIYNQSKIYVDAYAQENTPGGEFFPEVNDAIGRHFFKGHSVIGYIGHGGPKGWGHERFLTFTDIANWDNPGKYPLFITATCSFTGYDDPKENSAGERILMRERSGAVALFSTVRAVFSQSNARLTRAVYDSLFVRFNGENPTFGEIIRKAKNANSQDTSGITINSRKFALFGDPSQKFDIPTYDVSTTHINGISVGNGTRDTLRALQEVTIEGEITAPDGALITGFNGTIFPSIFDKRLEVKTLAQDPGSQPSFTFSEQKNIIFKGAASVQDGKFAFTFVIPKDINYIFGEGKISYYAHNGKDDAAGYYDKIVIGGVDADIPEDDTPPVVNVFMNNANFEFGGTTSPDPLLYIELSDDNGINVAGSSIGHDLVAVLDGDTKNTYRLNDFYESALDNHTSGTVRFPLKDIAPGRHRIEVKAWDIANNSGEGFTEFVVIDHGGPTVTNLKNYPNPVSHKTTFQFEHNLAGNEFDVQIQIFTSNGQLVRTISTDVFSANSVVDDIEWDGTGDYGETMTRGIYVYYVKIQSTNSNESDQIAESDFEKLVLLK